MSETEALKAELAYWQRVIGDRYGADDRRFSDMVRDLKEVLSGAPCTLEPVSADKLVEWIKGNVPLYFDYGGKAVSYSWSPETLTEDLLAFLTRLPRSAASTVEPAARTRLGYPKPAHHDPAAEIEIPAGAPADAARDYASEALTAMEGEVYESEKSFVLAQYIQAYANACYAAPTPSPNPVVADYATTETPELDAAREALDGILSIAQGRQKRGLYDELHIIRKEAIDAILAALSRPAHGGWEEEALKALKPFAEAARNFTCTIGPDGIDDGVSVACQLHGRREREAILTSADFSFAAAVVARNQGEGGGPRS